MSASKRAAAACALVLAIVGGSAWGRATPSRAWQVVGEKLIANDSASDRIYAPGGRRFEYVKICASRAPLKLREAAIVFRSGSRQFIVGRKILAPGDCTRAVNLKGRARDVQYVWLDYERTYRGTLAPIVQITAR